MKKILNHLFVLVFLVYLKNGNVIEFKNANYISMNESSGSIFSSNRKIEEGR